MVIMSRNSTLVVLCRTFAPPVGNAPTLIPMLQPVALFAGLSAAVAWFDLTAYKGGHQLGDSREILFDVLKLLLILVGAAHPEVFALFLTVERVLG